MCGWKSHDGQARMPDLLQYRYGFDSGNAFLINSTRGFASSATITSTTSKRKRMSGLSSIRSHASAPREIRFRFSRSTAANGRPKSSRVRVFTSINTRVSLSRQQRRFRRHCVHGNCGREFCNRYASGTGTLISRRARRAGDDRIWTISSKARSGCATGSKDRRWIGQGPNSWSFKRCGSVP